MANILVADPNATMRKTVVENIRALSHRLFEAEDGAKAVQILKETKIQAFFLDVDVLEQEGLPWLAEARKAAPSVSVVVMVGLGDDVKKWSSAPGVFATLSKPFNAQGLRRILTEAIQNSKLPVKPDPSGEPGKSRFQLNLSKKTALIAAMAAGLLLALAAGSYFYLGSRRAPPRFEAVPRGNLSSIAVTPDAVWLCDWFDQVLLKYSRSGQFALQETVEMPAHHPSSLAWDGENLWSYSSWEKVLIKHRMEKGLPKAEEYAVSGDVDIGPMCRGEDTFWVYDSKSSRLGTLTLQNGKAEVGQWSPSPSGKKIVGLFWDEKALWSVDAAGNVFKHAADLSPESGYVLSPVVLGMQGAPSFFAKQGIDCWVGAQGGKGIVSFSWKWVKRAQ